MQSYKQITVLRVFCAVLIFTAVFFFFLRPVETEDIWWHLSTGRWIVEHRAVPDYDIFAFDQARPAPGTYFQWLGSVIYYGVYVLGGFAGLKIFRVLTVQLVLLLFFWYSSRKSPPLLSFILALILAFSVHGRALLRPFVFNMLFVQALLIGCLGYAVFEKKYARLALFALGAVWFNIHLGAFVYGGLILGAFGLEYMLGVWQKNRAQVRSACGRVFLSAAAYVFGFVCNPTGIKGVLYPFFVFLDPNYERFQFYKFSQFIYELQPPRFIFNWHGWWFHSLFFPGLLLLVFNKKRRLSFTLLFASATALFLMYQRASLFFAVVSVYTISENLNDVLSGSWLAFLKRSWLQWVLIVSLGAGFLAHAVLRSQQRYVIDGTVVLRRDLVLDTDNPREAVEFLKQHGFAGRVFNSDVYGGYLIWDGYPHFQPFVDTRQFDQWKYLEYQDILKDPERLWPAFAVTHGVKIVLLDMENLSAWRMAGFLLYDAPAWHLCLLSKSSAVFLEDSLWQGLPESVQTYETRLKEAMVYYDRLDVLRAVGQGRLDFKRYAQAESVVYAQTVEEGLILFNDLGLIGAGLGKVVDGFEYLPRKEVFSTASALREFFQSQGLME